MRGLDDKAIKDSIKECQDFIIDYVSSHFADDADTDEVSVILTDNMVNYKCPAVAEDDTGYRLFCLGNGISNVMAMSDIVVFAPGWVNSKGCVVEAFIAKLYGKNICMINRDYSTGDLYVASHDAFITQLKLAMTLYGINSTNEKKE